MAWCCEQVLNVLRCWVENRRKIRRAGHGCVFATVILQYAMSSSMSATCEWGRQRRTTCELSFETNFQLEFLLWWLGEIHNLTLSDQRRLIWIFQLGDAPNRDSQPFEKTFRGRVARFRASDQFRRERHHQSSSIVAVEAAARWHRGRLYSGRSIQWICQLSSKLCHLHWHDNQQRHQKFQHVCSQHHLIYRWNDEEWRGRMRRKIHIEKLRLCNGRMPIWRNEKFSWLSVKLHWVILSIQHLHHSSTVYVCTQILKLPQLLMVRITSTISWRIRRWKSS